VPAKEPEFVGPNIDARQIRDRFSGHRWSDYTSIKTPADMTIALGRVDSDPTTWRIVRHQAGRRVVYPEPGG
jgi:hypothetical protein